MTTAGWTRRRGVAARSRVLAAALLIFSGCSSSGTPASEIGITIEPPAAGAPSFVRVSGLSSDEAADLRTQLDSQRQNNSPSNVLTVTVQGAEISVVGRMVVNNTGLEFHPAFPFDAGRPYTVRLDTSQWRAPRSPAVAVAVVSLPAPADTARAVVSAIRPSQDRWPENTLRFYVHFSAPMSQASGVGKVHLVGEDGEDIQDALLPLHVDLWNEDRTRYTVLFDPARVKRGILSNRAMGRALVNGRRYAIVVDADWRDASGRPLASAYRHEFTAGPPIEHALDTTAWRLAVPNAGTRDALLVSFPFALDSALLTHSIAVVSGGQQTLAGKVEVVPSATEWRFIPDAAWSAGRHQLQVSAVLEDPAGNRINRAFEIDPHKASATPDTQTRSMPFTVSGP